MTADIDWPPPICEACKDSVDSPPDHDDCRRDLVCECACPWLWEEDACRSPR